MTAVLPLDSDFRGNERFEVRGRLGAGGMGVVYRVFDKERDEEVALKTLIRMEARSLYRFKREFRALADVFHPNLVGFHELVRDGEDWFFTMELVEGTDFLAYVRPDAENTDDLLTAICTAPHSDLGPVLVPQRVEAVPRPQLTATSRPVVRRPGDTRPRGITAPLHLERLRDGMSQLAEGVQALHDAGMLHCDVKPSNVRVTQDGRVVLLDFGLVTELPTTLAFASVDKPVVGTAAYMSPEQGAGHELSPASDWYSVGVMLYQALTGRLPFYGGSVEVLMRKRKVMPAAPRTLEPRIPADLNKLCMDLLRTRPDERPPGAEVLFRLGGGSIRTALLSERPRPAVVPNIGTPKSIPPAPPVTDFVGRERHLARLGSAYKAMASGQAVTVFVDGRPGSGKTSLVQTFLAGLVRSGRAVVLSGRCYQRESVPFKALDSLVDELTSALNGTDSRW